jgi:hypothetical protein
MSLRIREARLDRLSGMPLHLSYTASTPKPDSGYHMKRITTFLLLFILIFSITASAATPRFELKDGSVVSGTISDFTNGIYTVISPSLGTVQIRQEEIQNIVYGGSSHAASGQGDAGVSQDQIQAIQKSMAQDPGMMSLIQALQNDPEMQALLADPEITRAVAAGDFAALLNNRKILQLMEDPKIKAIVRKAEGG